MARAIVDREMDMENEKCSCGVLEKIAEKYSYPFHEPMTFNFATGEMGIGTWAARCFNLTQGGRVSRKQDSHGTVFLNFCPFCGGRLREMENAEDNQDAAVVV